MLIGLPKRGCHPTADLRPRVKVSRFEEPEKFGEGCYELCESL